MGVSTMPIQRLQPTSPQQQQMANMRARHVAEAQQRPYRTDQLQQDMVRTKQPIGLPAGLDRVGVPSMSQLMSGIYGGGMSGGFNPYMGGSMGRGMGRGMGFGGFNPYMGGGGMGFGGFNPYMGGRGMGRGGFNPYMAQPQPMQLPDFARQMYGIGQRTNPYMPTALMPESTSGQPLQAFSGQINPQLEPILKRASSTPPTMSRFSDSFAPYGGINF